MNAHIVCSVTEEDRILPRMARMLANETGWSLGHKPRGNCDLNLFLPYLDYAPGGTKTAAYFTHYDAPHASKVQRWERAAREVDVRVVTARQYGNLLAEYGTTVYAPPPLDREKFTLGQRPAAVTVGLAGFVDDHDNRKGQDLVRRLVGDFLRLKWTAIGRGWPVPTRQIDDSQLAAWYRSLSLFVCASRVEGVPYPPLEALACGVPVVIPRGVGMLDDLPTLRGIYRFEAGDYASLKAAFALALAEHGLPDAEALRAATEPYTPQAWALALETALEPIIHPVVVESLPDWTEHAGIYVVAYGEEARACAERCLRSCAQHMPGVPTALVSDRPLGLETHFIQEADYDVGARRAKLKIDELAPADWKYVLYLDADTELTAPIPLLFELLQDGYEFVICTNPERFHTTRNMKRPDNHEEVERTYAVMGYDDMVQFNGGVFAFRRNDQTAAFFRRWISEWMQEAKRDQAALLRALWAHPLRLYLLGNEWNTSTRYLPPERTAGILHHQTEARRAQGIIWHRGDSDEAFAKVAEWRRNNGKG